MDRRRLALAVFALLAAPSLGRAADKKKGGGDSFLQLPTLTATVLRHSGGRGVLTIDVGIDVQDGGLRRRAEQSVPLLRDAYLRELLIYAPSLGPGQPPNPDLIAGQLQRATDQALGKPGAKVLLGTILIN